MLRIQFLAALLITFVAAAGAQGTMRAEPSSQQKQLVAAFDKRVNDYLALRKKEAGMSPPPTSSPDVLEKNQKTLAARVRQARSQAKQGDIFTPPIAGYFRKQIAATLKAKQGETIRASLKRAEPLHGITVKVNDTYPTGAPLQSTPPSLLNNLPQLPKELEYRLVNNDLVLYDSAANIIVDIVPHAIAAP